MVFRQGHLIVHQKSEVGLSQARMWNRKEKSKKLKWTAEHKTSHRLRSDNCHCRLFREQEGMFRSKGAHFSKYKKKAYRIKGMRGWKHRCWFCCCLSSCCCCRCPGCNCCCKRRKGCCCCRCCFTDISRYDRKSLLFFCRFKYRFWQYRCYHVTLGFIFFSSYNKKYCQSEKKYNRTFYVPKSF